MSDRPRTRPAPLPWAMTIRLTATPYCPICGEPLNPAATSIIRSSAYCVYCAHSCVPGMDTAIHACASLMRDHDLDPHHLSEHSGVRFWTPRGPLGGPRTLLETHPAYKIIDNDTPTAPDYPGTPIPELDNDAAPA